MLLKDPVTYYTDNIPDYRDLLRQGYTLCIKPEYDEGHTITFTVSRTVPIEEQIKNITEDL